MDIHVLIPSLLVVFLLIYGAIGNRLDRVWGVDPSRMTPGYESGKQKNAVLLLARDLLVYAAFLLPQMNAASFGFVPESSMLYALAIVGALICLGGVISYAALFVSLRHAGEGMGAVIDEEIGTAAGKAFQFVSLLFALAVSAVCMRYFLVLAPFAGLEAEALPASCRCAVMLGLFALMPSVLSAARLGNEAEGKPLCMGGVLIAGLFSVLLLSGGGVSALAMRMGVGFQPALLMEKLTASVSYLCALIVSVRLAVFALRSLMKRPLPRRKKLPEWLGAAPYAVVLASCACLAFVHAKWLYGFAACAGMGIAAVSFGACALWFARIGRRMI